MDIDLLSTTDVLREINDEDRSVPGVVGAVIPQLARLVDLGVAALRAGGRVHYVGAGTSGRLAVLDAAELIPTFNLPDGTFVTHHAGGSRAIGTAVENAEDDAEAGAAELAADAGPDDLVIGLAASGRTPYVLGALAAARDLGAGTALISSDPDASANAGVDVAIPLATGPEAIAGSTRMKAGTAQKIALTSFSTAVMVRTGHTYSNLMVSMRATNAKLRGRTLRILGEATGASEEQCAAALTDANGDLKTALVRLLAGVDSSAAATALSASDGHVREALTRLGF
jgi:N-acetylmuramic acid 6-phosphate etherase